MKEFIEKLIGRLEERKTHFGTLVVVGKDDLVLNYNLGKMHSLEDAIEIVNQLAEEHKGGWIPCSERLPEEDVEDVLVWFEYFRYGEYNGLYQRMGISYTFKGDWSGFVNGQSGWSQLRILAWQPLPEPYKEPERVDRNISIKK